MVVWLKTRKRFKCLCRRGEVSEVFCMGQSDSRCVIPAAKKSTELYSRTRSLYRYNICLVSQRRQEFLHIQHEDTWHLRVGKINFISIDTNIMIFTLKSYISTSEQMSSTTQIPCKILPDLLGTFLRYIMAFLLQNSNAKDAKNYMYSFIFTLRVGNNHPFFYSSFDGSYHFFVLILFIFRSQIFCYSLFLLVVLVVLTRT